MIRVRPADDQLLVRAGSGRFWTPSPDIEVAGEASGGAEAVRPVRELRPDALLMDIRMPTPDGLAATRAITGDPALHEVKVVMLTTFELDEYVFEAIRSGTPASWSRTPNRTSCCGRCVRWWAATRCCRRE